MRIAYLTGQYPRATDTFIQREVASLRQLGFDVQTFSVRKSGAEHFVGEEQKLEYERTFYLLPPNIPLLIASHLMLVLTGLPRYFKAVKLALATCLPGFRGILYQCFYFAEAGILARQLQSRQIQHIHNHFADSSCTVAMLAAELSGANFSFTIHGPYIFFEPYRWYLGRKIERALFVACISNFCRSQCMFFSPLDCWEKLHIVHCGVDPKLFQPVTHEGPGNRLLYVGRLAAAKGLPVLLKSLGALQERYPEILLTVVGDGEDRMRLEQLASELGLDRNVKFLGYKSQTEVRQYLQETDIFVLPSFAEGVPVSLMEAMASGVPVISTRIAGISELVEDGASGYLVPPGSDDRLSEKIEQLYVDSEKRQSFGERGRSQVLQEFNLPNEARWLSTILHAAPQGSQLPTRPEQQTLPEKPEALPSA